MTTTYDPRHARYSDEADVRDEMTRVFDVCHECQRCVGRCTSFPSLFEMIGVHDDHDAGRLTPAQQDRVVDECFQCTLCAVDCPYTPARDDLLRLDFAQLMLRARAMQHENGHRQLRTKWATHVIGRTDLVAKLATTATAGANRVVTATPGSWKRKVTAALTGVSAVRLLPTFANERFSKWFMRRPVVEIGRKQGSVTVYPTCLVDAQATDIGKDLVKVYERNGIECDISDAGCCGAVWLHSGDVARFTKVASDNVGVLAAEIRRGTDVVVAQPTCGYVITTSYPVYVEEPLRSDAMLVAEHTHDAADYLMRIHRADATVLDTDFAGELHGSIVYHAPSHLRAQGIGLPGRDLMKLTGAKVDVVQASAGMAAMWGLRRENEDLALEMACELGEMIEAAAGDAVAGDCHLANTAIREQTGRTAQHPLQILARAYGFAPE